MLLVALQGPTIAAFQVRIDAAGDTSTIDKQTALRTRKWKYPRCAAQSVKLLNTTSRLDYEPIVHHLLCVLKLDNVPLA